MRAGWRVFVAVMALAATAARVVAQEPAPSPPGAASVEDRLAAFEERLRALEEQNRRLAEENRELRDQVGRAPTPSLPDPNPAPDDGDAASGDDRGLGELAAPEPLGGTSFDSIPDSPVPDYNSVTEEAPEPETRLRGGFAQGFEFLSRDEEFLLQVHLESQLDYRGFDPNGEEFARPGFYSPRNRIFFGGRLTKPVEYLFSINRGFGGLDLLDSWVNFRADDRLQLKLGRMMTPFNYEQFAIQNMWLIAPERSLFTSNLGLNRQFGGMVWGTLLEKRLDYAVGVYNGPRNSYEDFNDAKDTFAYLNARPFQALPEGNPLRFLNVGGSFVYGEQDNPLVPASFRLAANASNAGTSERAAPPFLRFNPGVEERGQRTFWSANVAYFYRSLSVVADYNGGILRYARNAEAPASAVLPVSGYSIAAGYFLTGEEIERRTIVEPLRPFNLKRGQFGLGAIEPIARFTTFDLDPEVFAAGLADPELWSNRAWVTNLGLNWYPNEYVKIYVDWQHGEFGSPVFFAPPDRRSLTNEMIWIRCQLYF